MKKAIFLFIVALFFPVSYVIRVIFLFAWLIVEILYYPYKYFFVKLRKRLREF